MKMTFEVPDEVGEHFRKLIPAGQRSRLIASFMQQETKRRRSRVEQACERANRLTKVTEEMREWEKFDDSEG